MLGSNGRVKVRAMNVRRSLLLSAALFAAFAGSAEAGPCSDQIARAQADLDQRIEADAASAGSQPESVEARLHHQPTPGSVAQAEQRSGSKTDNERALAVLAQARKADESGDRAACEQALKELTVLTR
jgi:hypothetical protein